MKKLSSKQAHLIMQGICIMLIIGVFTSTYFVNSWLHTRSDKLVQVKLDNRLIDEQQTSLIAANKTVQKYTELNNIARAIVPQDKDQAKAVRELVKVADETGIKLGAISFPASTLGQTVPKGTAAPSSVTQVKPVSGIPGVYTMEINVQQDAASPTSYTKLIDFLSRLENNRRTAQVINVTVQPTPQDRNKLTFSLVVNTYIKP